MEYNIEVLNIMHPGKRKDKDGNPHQEDAIFPAEEQLKDSDRLFVLCDGMGGHDSGEVASATVCQAIGSYITAHCPQGNFTPENLDGAIEAAFDALDDVDTGASLKMGTTMVMLMLYNKGAVVAHIGDSRVYHIRPGDDGKSAKVLHRTADHSLVFEMINAGIMTEEDARRSPHRNVITKALQPHLESRPRPDITKIKDIRPGDFFYVCSDGMIENMDIPELEEIFASGDIRLIRQTLLALTEENDDNHAAFIIRIKSVESTGNEKDLTDDFDDISLPPSVLPSSAGTDSGADTPDYKRTILLTPRHESEEREFENHDTASRDKRNRQLIIKIIAAITTILAILACLAALLN